MSVLSIPCIAVYNCHVFESGMSQSNVCVQTVPANRVVYSDASHLSILLIPLFPWTKLNAIQNTPYKTVHAVKTSQGAMNKSC